MALARIKTWIAGEILTAADLNGEFNNILSNPISLVSPTTGVITFTTAQTFPGNQVSGSVPSAGAGSRVKGLNGTISSQTGTFTADQYVLQTTNPTSSAGSFVLNSTGSFTVNVGTAGPAAGGRDIAAVFASTYVHWYAISTGANSTAVAGIVSTATPPTGPVMPTSYSAWAYLGGSVYTSASTTVLGAHRFRGADAAYDSQISLVAAANTTAETAVSLTGSIPNNALTARLSAGDAPSATLSAAFTFQLRTVTGINAVSWQGAQVANTNLFLGGNPVLPNVSQSFFYLATHSAGTGTHNTNIQCDGYTMPNGDA